MKQAHMFTAARDLIIWSCLRGKNMRNIILVCVLALGTACGDSARLIAPPRPAATATASGVEPRMSSALPNNMDMSMQTQSTDAPTTASAQSAVSNGNSNGSGTTWRCTREAECWGRRCVAGICASQERCDSDENCVFGSVCESNTCQNHCERDRLDDVDRLRTPFHSAVDIGVGLESNLTLCPNDYDVFQLEAGIEVALVQARSVAVEQMRLVARGQRVVHCPRDECSLQNRCQDGYPCAWEGERREGVVNQPGEASVYLQHGETLYVERRIEATDMLRYDLEIR